MKNIVIITTPDELEKIIEKVLDKKLSSPTSEPFEKTYSVNQVAKMLGRSHQKICSLIEGNVLKTTPDNRVFESSIREYNQVHKK